MPHCIKGIPDMEKGHKSFLLFLLCGQNDFLKNKGDVQGTSPWDDATLEWVKSGG